MDVWVVEKINKFEEIFSIKLYDDKVMAQEEAIKMILKRLKGFYYADDPNTSYHVLWNNINSLKDDGLHNDAIEMYNDWVYDRPEDEQSYIRVISKLMNCIHTKNNNGPKKVKYDCGASCKCCGEYNKYVEESNQDDGTYKCGLCRGSDNLGQWINQNIAVSP